MKRFPADLLVVVFGPILVVAVALGFGSLIFHVDQLRGTAMGVALAVAAIVVLLMLLFLRWRHQRARRG